MGKLQSVVTGRDDPEGGSGINAAHPILDPFDHRAALAALARGVLRRTALGARHWLVVWPGIPEPTFHIPRIAAPSTRLLEQPRPGAARAQPELPLAVGGATAWAREEHEARQPA
jgi:hypothetical protein